MQTYPMGARRSKIAFAGGAILLLSSMQADAHPSRPPIRIVEAVCPLPPNGARTAEAGFAVINDGAPDRLVGIASPAATTVTLHAMSMAGGVMRMAPIAGGVAVAHGITGINASSGRHAMFIRLKAPFHSGQRVPMTLSFARAGRVVAACVVKPRG